MSKMETKAGYKTTEFWLTMVSNLLGVFGVVKGMIDPNTAAVILAVLNGAYGVLRALQKQPSITTLVENKTEVAK